MRDILVPKQPIAAFRFLGLAAFCGLLIFVVLAWSQTEEDLTVSFLRDTEDGQTIIAYLNCIDIDCIRAESKVSKLTSRAVPPLIYLLRNGMPRPLAKQVWREDIRLSVISALAAIGDSRALPHLIPLLKDEKATVRASAASALGKFGDKVQPDLLVPVLRDSDTFVRESAAAALGRIGRREILPILEKHLEMEPQEHVRKVIRAAMISIEAREPPPTRR